MHDLFISSILCLFSVYLAAVTAHTTSAWLRLATTATVQLRVGDGPTNENERRVHG